MNTKETKEFIIHCIKNERGDDLARARCAFHSFSPEEMQEQYGQSGRTRQEVLDDHFLYDQKCNDAIKWHETMATSLNSSMNWPNSKNENLTTRQLVFFVKVQKRE